jgi:hypothetical protein
MWGKKHCYNKIALISLYFEGRRCLGHRQLEPGPQQTDKQGEEEAGEPVHSKQGRRTIGQTPVANLDQKIVASGTDRY